MKRKKISLLLAGAMLISIILSPFTCNVRTVKADVVTNESRQDEKNKVEIFFSDLDYIDNKSSVGFGEIKKNTNIEGGNITLLINGSPVTFDKGMGAHATSTLVYDISTYSTKYNRLLAYIGVDYSKGSNGNGVKFTISTSDDGEIWKEIESTDVVKGNSESIPVDINVKGVKYIKFYADSNGNNGTDHSVYGDLKLVSNEYDTVMKNVTGVMTVADFDKKIKESGSDATSVAKNQKQLLYQREFVNRVGYDVIKILYNKGDKYQKGLEKLFNNETALSYYIETGRADSGASYLESLKNFSDIYAKYQGEIDKDKDFLLKLAVSVAWSHAKPVYFWTGTGKPHNAVQRFETYKKLVEEGTMNQGGDSNIFKTLTPTMMKFTTDSRLHEDEVEWLAKYALKQKEANKNYLDAYNYIEYKGGYNYNKDDYYSQENYDKWNKKYDLSSFKDYGTKGVQRNFMVFEEGSVCGGLAKTYATLAEVFGRPAQVVHQPGHAATMVYEVNSKTGKGYWSLKNDVFGWAQSRDEMGVMPLGWGMQSWNSDRSASYIVLAQNVLNDYDNYATTLRMNILADVYKNDRSRQEGIYKEALKVQNINLDSMVGLINTYKADTTKKSKDYLELARMITNNFKYYPLAMSDLLNLIKDKIEGNDITVFDLLKNNALIEASKATDKEINQPEVSKQLANSLLGKDRVDLASFSFDGENSNKIVINSKYDSSEIRVRYSLDGGRKWNETGEHIIKLSKEELESITAENDIKVGLVGVNDIFNIDIMPGLNVSLYANDLENRLIGNTTGLEYSLDSGNTWKDYTDETILDGKEVVQARYKAQGTRLQGESSEFNFNEDSDDMTRKYIPLKNITLESFSTQQDEGSRAAKNFIDGNANTEWHSKFYTKDNDKTYVVKLDRERYITALEYKSGSGANGRVKKAEVYTSLNGKDWTLAGTVSELKNNNSVQDIPLDKPTKALYVKFKGVETYGNTTGEVDMYISGSMLNFYEDATKLEAAPEEPSKPEPSTQDKDKYDPGVSELIVQKGMKITEDNVKDKVTIPKESKGEITAVGKIPETDTPGDKGTVDVTITYPDKTIDVVKVPVKVVEAPVIPETPHNDKYESGVSELIVKKGSDITEDNVKSKVTIPNGSNGKIEKVGEIPKADASGDKNPVDVTITYPDKTTEMVKVPVKVTDEVTQVSDNNKYQPGVSKLIVFRKAIITENDVRDRVTISNGSSGKIEKVGEIPNTDIPGDKESIDVTVAYPDKTTDVVKVPVKIIDVPETPIVPDNDKYQPSVSEFVFKIGTKVTEDDVKDKVTIPNGSNGEITEVGEIPETSKPGDKGTIDVTITYPDGTKDVVKVPYRVEGEVVAPVIPESEKYNPSASDLIVERGTKITIDDVIGKVIIVNGSNGKIIDVGEIPDTNTPGDKGTIDVTITYSDGTKDVVKVPVKVKDVPVIQETPDNNGFDSNVSEEKVEEETKATEESSNVDSSKEEATVVKESIVTTNTLPDTGDDSFINHHIIMIIGSISTLIGLLLVRKNELDAERK